MIPPVLAPRECVQVEIDSETILPRPLDGLEEVLPRCVGQKSFTVENLDGPITDRNADKVEAGGGYLHKILLGDKGLVVILEGSLATGLQQGVLVDDGDTARGRCLDRLVESRCNKL